MEVQDWIPLQRWSSSRKLASQAAQIFESRIRPLLKQQEEEMNLTKTSSTAAHVRRVSRN